MSNRFVNFTGQGLDTKFKVKEFIRHSLKFRDQLDANYRDLLYTSFFLFKIWDIY